MGKGKLGVTYRFYAVLAFALLLFGQWLLCGLLCGLVLLVEKDEWTTRQCMQAFFLSFIFTVLEWVGDFFGNFAGAFYFWLSRTDILYMLGSVFQFVIWAATAVLALMGMSRVAKGNEANIPVVSEWAYKAFGYVKSTPVYPAPQPPSYGYPQPPVAPPTTGPAPQAPQPQEPHQGAPVYGNPASPAAPPYYPPAGQPPAGSPDQNQ